MGSELIIFGANVKSKSAVISAEDRINIYFEVPAEPDRSPIAAYGTAGTEFVFEPSGFKTRAMYFMPATGGIIFLQGRKIFHIVHVFNAQPVLIATLPNTQDTDGMAHFTDNGTQILLVTRDHSYIIDTSNNYFLTDITHLLPAEGVDYCTFLDGYFIVNRRGTGQFFISNVYDGLVWDALNFATAESSPDSLKAPVSNNSYLYLLGEYTTEVWGNNGDPLFTFGRIQGATITYGIVDVGTIAIINTQVIGLWRDRYGMLAVGTITNGVFQELSTPDISYIINAYPPAFVSHAFVYALNGRYFYQLTFDGVATWLYDFKSGAWSRIKSHGLEHSRYRYSVAYGNKYIMADANSGSLATLNADVYTEQGDPIEREIIFNQVFAPSQNFTLVGKIRACMDTGNGIVPVQGVNTSEWINCAGRVTISDVNIFVIRANFADVFATGAYIKFTGDLGTVYGTSVSAVYDAGNPPMILATTTVTLTMDGTSTLYDADTGGGESSPHVYYQKNTVVIGNTQGSNPTLYLQASRDAGRTWGNYMPTEIGKRGQFLKRAEWRRLGQARVWAFKLRMTDPVRFCLVDFALSVGEAND